MHNIQRFNTLRIKEGCRLPVPTLQWSVDRIDQCPSEGAEMLMWTSCKLWVYSKGNLIYHLALLGVPPPVNSCTGPDKNTCHNVPQDTSPLQLHNCGGAARLSPSVIHKSVNICGLCSVTHGHNASVLQALASQQISADWRCAAQARSLQRMSPHWLA